MPFFIFVKIRKFFAKYCILWNRAIAPVIHIFSQKLSPKQIFLQKQIFSRASARISCHLNIFTKMVPLFHMLLTSFAFFLRNLKKSTFRNFANFFVIFAYYCKQSENIHLVWTLTLVWRAHVVFLWITLFKDMSIIKPTCEYFRTWM